MKRGSELLKSEIRRTQMPVSTPIEARWRAVGGVGRFVIVPRAGRLVVGYYLPPQRGRPLSGTIRRLSL